MRELERLFEAMQPHWPVRKYVNNTSPPPPHPLSETAVPKRSRKNAPFAERFNAMNLRDRLKWLMPIRNV